jgi:hypothetical protein
MKKILALATAVLVATQVNLPARAVEDSPADFFRKDREYWSQGRKAPAEPDYSWAGSLNTNVTSSVPANRAHIASKVRERTQAELGSQWVPTALSLARLESGFNCKATGPKTRHGRAKGVFQVMPQSARALGYDYSRLHDCDHGIAAGVAHMKACIRSGVKTHNEMAKCHVAGVGGWNTRLNPRAENYKRKYVRLASRM